MTFERGFSGQLRTWLARDIEQFFGVPGHRYLSSSFFSIGYSHTRNTTLHPLNVFSTSGSVVMVVSVDVRHTNSRRAHTVATYPCPQIMDAEVRMDMPTGPRDGLMGMTKAPWATMAS